MPEKKQSVLIVEDDILISEAISEGLARAKINTITAMDGEEGLKAALKHHPDLVILDLIMPNMNGHEMLDELRSDKWGANVPVLVLTNASDNLNQYFDTKYTNISYAIKSSMKLEDITKIVKSRLKAASN